MTKTLDKADIRRWMARRHYREGTIRQTESKAVLVHTAWEADPKARIPDAYKGPLGRFVAYAEQTEQHAAFCAWLAEQGIHAPSSTPREKPKRRKLEAVSFDQGDYDKLCDAFEVGTEPADRVLRVIAATGLRVGDVLRIPTEVLAAGLAQDGKGLLSLEKKGGNTITMPIEGARDAWQDLYENLADDEAESVASWLTDNPSPEAGDPAYKCVYRHFQKVAATLGIKGRVHPHRLRRTMATRALTATDRDLVTVAQLMGHSTIATTQRYVDELDAVRVADVQRKVRGGRRGAA
jgi:integrase